MPKATSMATVTYGATDVSVDMHCAQLGSCAVMVHILVDAKAVDHTWPLDNTHVEHYVLKNYAYIHTNIMWTPL